MSHPRKSTYIIGHKNPDADAICSAIAYAAYKHAIGQPNHVPARCGNSNARIDAILKRFHTPLPVFIGDVTPRIADIMRCSVRKINQHATCHEALEIIDRHDVRALPVVGDGDVLKGLLSIFHLGEFFIPKPREPRKMRHVHTSVSQIVEALDAKVLHLERAEAVEDLYVRIGAMDIRSFGKAIASEGTPPEQSIIVVGDRYDIQLKAIQTGARLLVITGGLDIDEGVLEMARERGVSLIISPFDSATTSWIIRTATLVGPMVQSDVVTFSPEEKLHLVKRKIANTFAPVYCVIDEDEKLVGIFSKTDLLQPVNTDIILVDHNELGQAVNGAAEVNISEIIDHHRLGNAPTAQPIYFRNEIIGSTCSIVAGMFRESGLDPAPDTAGLMAAGLISDTLNLQSPTTTERDRELLPWLAQKAGIESDELARLIFESGSIVLSSDPADIITADCKGYQQGDLKYSVSQVEELGFDNFQGKSEAILEALEAYRKSEGLDFSTLLVTDINRQNSLLLVRGMEEVREKISYPNVNKNPLIFDLPGIVSRKKQLIPYLTTVLENLGA